MGWLVFDFFILLAIVGLLFLLKRQHGLRTGRKVRARVPRAQVRKKQKPAGGQGVGVADLLGSGRRGSDRPRDTSDEPPAVIVSPEGVVRPISESAGELHNTDPTGSLVRVVASASGNSRMGVRRTHNEDDVFIDPGHLFLVADGMGGHAGGGVASRLAIETLSHALQTQELAGEPIPGVPKRADELVRAIWMANERIAEHARANPGIAGAGTTLVAARFSSQKKRTYIASVGDSRCYRIRDGDIRQITSDHAIVKMKGARWRSPVLLRAIGVRPKVEIDLFVDEPEAGDYYLLCSDGLWKTVLEHQMVEIVTASRDLETAVSRLLDAAVQTGGKDDVSVILVRIDAPGTGSLAAPAVPDSGS